MNWRVLFCVFSVDWVVVVVAVVGVASANRDIVVIQRWLNG